MALAAEVATVAAVSYRGMMDSSLAETAAAAEHLTGVAVMGRPAHRSGWGYLRTLGALVGEAMGSTLQNTTAVLVFSSISMRVHRHLSRPSPLSSMQELTRYRSIGSTNALKNLAKTGVSGWRTEGMSFRRFDDSQRFTRSGRSSRAVSASHLVEADASGAPSFVEKSGSPGFASRW